MRENGSAFMSHSKTAPTLPTVVDEAADTPNWVPALGFGLFALIAMVIAASTAWSDSHPPPPAAAAAVAADAPAPAPTPAPTAEN
jgi:hypothetical protein